MKNILDKKQMVNSAYEVQFFIGGDTFYEKYRVKGKDGSTYLLKYTIVLNYLKMTFQITIY